METMGESSKRQASEGVIGKEKIPRRVQKDPF